VALPALDIAPPAIFWTLREIAIDAFHHTVYAVATGIAYELLSNARGARTGISERSGVRYSDDHVVSNDG
jgi:hypothetical protein